MAVAGPVADPHDTGQPWGDPGGSSIVTKEGIRESANKKQYKNPSMAPPSGDLSEGTPARLGTYTVTLGQHPHTDHMMQTGQVALDEFLGS